LDPSYFSKVLAGKRSAPSEEDVLRRIAQVLGLNAVDLVVAAGRIPREWRRLWDDPRLFETVNALAGGAGRASWHAASAPPQETKVPVRPAERVVAPRGSLSEELL
jgi:hypothetical protein